MGWTMDNCFQNGWGKKKWCCSNKGIGCQEGQWPSGVCDHDDDDDDDDDHDDVYGTTVVGGICGRSDCQRFHPFVREDEKCHVDSVCSWELAPFFTLLPFCFDTNVIYYTVRYNISVSVLPCLRNAMFCCVSSLPRGTFWGHDRSWQHWHVSGLARFPAQTAPSDDSPWLCYEKPEVGA